MSPFFALLSACINVILSISGLSFWERDLWSTIHAIKIANTVRINRRVDRRKRSMILVLYSQERPAGQLLDIVYSVTDNTANQVHMVSELCDNT